MKRVTARQLSLDSSLYRVDSEKLTIAHIPITKVERIDDKVLITTPVEVVGFSADSLLKASYVVGDEWFTEIGAAKERLKRAIEAQVSRTENKLKYLEELKSKWDRDNGVHSNH